MTAGTINDNRLARIPRVRRAGAAGNSKHGIGHDALAARPDVPFPTCFPQRPSRR